MKKSIKPKETPPNKSKFCYDDGDLREVPVPKAIPVDKPVSGS